MSDMVAREKQRKAVLRARQAILACSNAVVKARHDFQVCETDLVASLRELEESENENTPVRPASQTTLEAVKGVAARVGHILDKGKK